jgi:uncharacterized protein
MLRIGLLSDTHGFLDPLIFSYFGECDEIWHAGDFGTVEVSDRLAAFRPLKGVYGNIDGNELRLIHPLHSRFEREGLKIWMTHIGGYPGHYHPAVRALLKESAPDIFVCGHSHILRVMRDKNLGNMLCLNPGAAGNSGFHKVKTLLRFTLDKKQVREMEVIELGKRSATASAQL